MKATQHHDPVSADSYEITRSQLMRESTRLCGLLAPQEIEVLKLVAHGLSLKAVAGEMGLHILTVKHYTTGIGRKTGSFGRGNMVRLALRAGLVSIWTTHPAEIRYDQQQGKG